MAGCKITGVPGGDMLVTIDTAQALYSAGIIHLTDILGNYEMNANKDIELWAFLRGRGNTECPLTKGW